MIPKLESPLYAALSACCTAALFACTQPTERQLIRVQIEAEASVRELVDEVQVVIETQEPNGGGWLVSKSPRFQPKVERKWPLESTVDSRGLKLNYLVTATARDERGSVVAEV